MMKRKSTDPKILFDFSHSPNPMMKRKSTDPQINPLAPPPEFDESYAEFLKHGHGVWDTYHDEAGKEFRKLKPFHQKFFKDIIAACLSRFDKGQSIGVLNLQNVKIRDGAVFLPLLGSKSANRNPALACFELFNGIIRSQGDIPYRTHFLVLLKMLGTEKEAEDLRIGFQSLLFHRFLGSAKENNDLVGNALEYLNKNAEEMTSMFAKQKWDEAYKKWTRGRSYNIQKAIQGDKCLLDLYQHRVYLDTCIHVLQFLKNTFKHINEHRDKRGELKWSHENMEINMESRFPSEIGTFFQFMWLTKVPMDFKKSELAIPHIRKCSGVVNSMAASSEKEAALAAVPSDPTIFDKIINKEIPASVVFEDDKVLAFRHSSPLAPTHILIIPKVRDGLTGLSKAEERHCEILGRLMYTAKLVAKQEGLDDGFRIVINDGPQGCQSVNHILVHLLGGRQMNWPPD